MASYDPDDYPPAAVTVDIAALALRDDSLHVLTVRRGEAPYAGRRALPGGFVEPDEDLRQAALRELHEETGVKAARAHIEQLGAYGAPRRDPRMRVVSVAHLVVVPDAPEPVAGGDAASSQWRPVAEMLSSSRRLAFDHARILRDAVDRASDALESSALATWLCRTPFTVAELRRVYEVLWGQPLDPRNFHRKMTCTPGLLVDTRKTTTRNGGRPATLYRRGRATRLNPPLVRA